MPTKLKVLQVIPKLGYGGAETGCYDLAHYLYENNCDSFLITSGGELLKYVNKYPDSISVLLINTLLNSISFLEIISIFLFISIR